MIGRKLGHYSFLEKVGQGGMGVVYRARDEHLQRDVAVKFLSRALTGQEEARERVLAEARAAAALNHPAIVTIFEVAEHEEQVFLVMEWVEGRNLRSLCHQSPDIRTVVRIGVQVADALATAHGRGIVHRDVKPENVVVQPNGRVKLLDFGLALLPSHGSAITLTQDELKRTTSGTLAYMSPEQIRGEPLDGRSDLFSLGLVLLEIATGHHAYSGPNPVAIMTQILRDPVPPIDRSRVPAEMARILRKLLQKDPAERYQSARDLYLDLNSLSRDLEVGAAMPAAVKDKKSVAVLPFKLLTGNNEDSYLSIALADSIVNDLSADGELLVRPTSTVTKYERHSQDPLTAARELGVDVVIEGSIQRAGKRLRVQVQAWSAETSSASVSAKEEADTADLFALQDRLGRALRKALGSAAASGKTSSSTPAAPPTGNPIAYELYLRSTDRLSRLNRWDTRTAIEMLENAVKLDPKFADAWARLAAARVLMGTTMEPNPKWISAAELALRKALKLDPANAGAHCARGRVLWTPAKNFKNSAALVALQTALRLNPGCHEARIWQCLIYMHVGLHEEAREGLLTALAVHPEDAFVLVFLGQTAMYRYELDEAEEFQARALALDPAHLWANVFYPTIPLYMGRLDDAEQKIKSARHALGDDPWLTSCEALLAAKRGDAKRSQALLHKALRGKPLLHTHHMWHTAAATYAIINKPQLAMNWLEKAGGFGLPNYTAFRDDPHFAVLRGNPRFEALLTKLRKEREGYARDFGNPDLLAKRASAE